MIVTFADRLFQSDVAPEASVIVKKTRLYHHEFLLRRATTCWTPRNHSRMGVDTLTLNGSGHEMFYTPLYCVHPMSIKH